MLDDFFIRAVIGGIGVALLAGPLGCFIVWRRLAYFGDTLSHSALLGVAIALLLELNITFTVFIISVCVAMILLLLQRQSQLSSDALLGLLAHATLAVGLVVLAFMTWVRVDLMGFLFGDILAINTTDIVTIWVGGFAVLIALAVIWKPLFAATVNYEIAVAEGLKPDKANFFFHDFNGRRNCNFDENRRRPAYNSASHHPSSNSKAFRNHSRNDGSCCIHNWCGKCLDWS